MKRAPLPTPEAPTNRTPARALLLALTALAVARIALGLLPSMAGWGLNIQRFVPRESAGLMLALPLLVLVPALSRPIAAWLDRRRIAHLGWRVAAALAAALLVWSLPDRVWFTGDFIGRQFSLQADGAGLAWYTHSMPLDTLVHQHLGRWLVRDAGLSPNELGRIVGAVEAGALAWIALSFAIEAGLTGAAALAAAAIAFWGGWLMLFTGYNKALSEVVIAVALFGVLGLRVIRNQRGLLALACTLGVALLLHRSALALIPAFAAAWIIAQRQAAAEGGARWQPRRIAALALPVLVLAAVAPQLVAMIRTYDAPLLALPAARAASAAIPNTRILDLLNALLFIAPLGMTLLPLGLAATIRAWRHAETQFFAALAIPFLVMAAWFYPPEGLFRFWDIVAPAGMALSLVAAWLAANIIQASPRHRGLCAGLVAAAMCPALLGLLHHTNTELGLQRVRAFLAEPPARAPELRASAYEFLGFRLIDLDRPAEAAEAFELAAAVVPSPRVLRQWATAETLAEDPVAAQSVLRRIVDRDPTNRAAWEALATQAIQNRDSVESVRSLEAILRLAPGDSRARQMLRQIAPGREEPVR